MNTKTKRWVSPAEQLEILLHRELKNNALLRALAYVKTLSGVEVIDLNEKLKGLPKTSTTYRATLDELAKHRE